MHHEKGKENLLVIWVWKKFLTVRTPLNPSLDGSCVWHHLDKPFGDPSPSRLLEGSLSLPPVWISASVPAASTAASPGRGTPPAFCRSPRGRKLNRIDASFITFTRATHAECSRPRRQERVCRKKALSFMKCRCLLIQCLKCCLVCAGGRGSWVPLDSWKIIDCLIVRQRHKFGHLFKDGK